MSKTSNIQIDIELDANKVAENISWEASETGDRRDAKAMILGFWDKQERNTLRIDLWTKEMTVDDMKKFIHQSIFMMADTLQKATGEILMAETMRDFGQYYGEKLGLVDPPQEEA